MWIDINDRLPSQHNKVCFVKTPYDHYQSVHHWDANKQAFVRWSESSQKEKITKNVTHWYDGIPSVSFDLPAKYVSDI